MAEELGIAITAWAPLNYGILTGKYSLVDGKLVSADGSKRYSPDQGAFLDGRKQAILATLSEIADRNRKTMAQIALAWLRSKRIIPIIGAKTKRQLEENLDYLSFELEEKELSELDRVSQIELGFPHDFLHRDGIRRRIFGDTLDRFDRLKL